MGLVVRKCHFDVTACAEARRLAQRAERSLRDLSALWTIMMTIAVSDASVSDASVCDASVHNATVVGHTA